MRTTLEQKTSDKFATRHARIEKRIEKRVGGGIVHAAASATVASSLALNQVALSTAALDDVKLRTHRELSEVKLTATIGHVARSREMGAEATARRALVVTETDSALLANAEIAMRWHELSSLSLPEDLAAALGAQKAASEAVLARKDALLQDLAQASTRREALFADALAQQALAVDTLAQRLPPAFTEARAARARELASIEAAFSAERAELLLSQRREIDALGDARRSLEVRFTEDRLVREDVHTTELYATQAAEMENYQKLKVKLENDIALLEQQLEAMKFTYLLNKEKLEYNYRVLAERDAENKAQLASEKSRLARLRASLAKSQANYVAEDLRFVARNQVIRGAYDRCIKTTSDLQNKAAHFEQADEIAYAAMVRGHEDEVATLLSRLEDAKKVVNSQLLGNADLSTLLALGSRVDGGGVYENGGGGGGGNGTGEGDNSVIHHSHPNSAATGLHSSSSHSLVGGGPSSSLVIDIQGGSDSVRTRGLLRLLAQEAQPLAADPRVEASARAAEASGRPSVAYAVRAQAALTAVNCTTQKDIFALCDYFDARLAAAGAAAAGGGSEVDDATGLGRLSPDIDDSLEAFGQSESPDLPGLASRAFSLSVTDETGVPRLPPRFSVPAVLRAWLVARNAAAAAAGARSLTQSMSVSMLLTGRTSGVDARDADVILRWATLGENALPPPISKLWTALQRGVERYRSTLNSRTTAARACERLAEENEALKLLISQYMKSPAATAQRVHPALTLRLGVAATGAIASLASDVLNPNSSSQQQQLQQQQQQQHGVAPLNASSGLLRVSGKLRGGGGIDLSINSSKAAQRS